MKMSDLMYFLGEIPMKHRSVSLAKELGIDFQNLVVYHATQSANVDSIKKNGIQARSSRQSYNRPNAVYFFVDGNEITQEVVGILGLSNDYTIIKVAIPVEHVVSKMQWDGLFNVSFGMSSTAVQYMDSIPAEWIID